MMRHPRTVSAPIVPFQIQEAAFWEGCVGLGALPSHEAAAKLQYIL